MGSVDAYNTSNGKRYRARYRTPEHRQAEKGGFHTKREAEQYLATIEVAKARGDWIDPMQGRTTIRECAAEWFSAQVQIKPTTRSGYRYTLNRHILPTWGEREIGAITHGSVQQWVSVLSTDLRPSTVRQIYLVLSGVLGYAVRDRRIARNPCDHIQLPRIERRARGYLTHRQVDELATQCADSGDIIRFLAYTGLRWGEMAALRVRNVDLTLSRVHVVASVSEISGDLVQGTPKSHLTRWVPIAGVLRDVLESRCQGKHPQDLVFTTRSGKMLRGSNFRRRVFAPAVAQVRAQDASFPDITPHDLRHTAASLIVAAGGSVKVLQRMLGHASAAMTLDVYADLFDDDLQDLATALDRHARHQLTNGTRPSDPIPQARPEGAHTPTIG